MTQGWQKWGLCAVALGLVAAAPRPEEGEGVVASDNALASAAGAEVLAMGGNAVDAAVATALAAGVVHPAGSGLGGGGFAVFDVEGARGSLDFRETAPAAAHETLYQDDAGEVIEGISRRGGLAVATPGEPRGLAWLVREHGELSLAQVAGPAIRLARRGFPMSAHLAAGLERTEYPDVLASFPADHRAGVRVRRPELARAIKRWARSDGEALNVGPVAEAMATAAQEAGGILTAEDLAGYEVREREPIVAPFGDYTVISMAPPSSGGVVLAQVLQVVADDDLAALGHNSSAYIHRLTEAFKHAYADRARVLGDPDYSSFDTGELLTPERIDEVRRAFDPAHTLPLDAYGMAAQLPEDAGTQHISVIDTDGGSCALTTTINTTFGSGVVVPGYGLILNNEMDDFAAKAGVPNAYGLVGHAANAVGAHKRPLSSTTPTLVLDGEGNVVLSLGASGGSTIITAVTQVLLNILVFEMDPQQAVSEPRFHHQWKPDRLWLEPGFSLDVQEALAERGHEVFVRGGFSAVQAVQMHEGIARGGADPRKGGWPAGVWLQRPLQ